MTIQLRAYVQRGKKKYKKTIHTIPYIFTFANALLGLLALIKAINADLSAAAYCILLAAFMDGLDGRLARAFGSTSALGAELDALCDAISFCVSPAILLYSWELQDFGHWGLVIIGLYLCAGLFRLAKFNSCTDHQLNSFLGLPTTIAAFFIAAIVLYEEWIALSRWYFVLDKPWLFIFIGLLSYLMISTIRFPAIKQYRMRSIAMFVLVLGAFLVFVLARVFGYPFFLLVLVGYVCSGIFNYLYQFARRLLISKF